MSMGFPEGGPQRKNIENCLYFSSMMIRALGMAGRACDAFPEVRPDPTGGDCS